MFNSKEDRNKIKEFCANWVYMYMNTSFTVSILLLKLLDRWSEPQFKIHDHQVTTRQVVLFVIVSHRKQKQIAKEKCAWLVVWYF